MSSLPSDILMYFRPGDKNDRKYSKREITGRKFNQLYGHKMFYKLLYENETHNGLRYETGLNVLLETETFNPTGECSKGGIYFADIYNIFCEYTMHHWIRRVTIPDDARVYVEDKKFKTDGIILGNRMLIKDMDEWNDDKMCEIIIRSNGDMVQYAKNKSYKLYKLAVESKGNALEHVLNQTDELCKIAVQKDGMALLYVKNKTKAICMLACEENFHAKRYIRDEKILKECEKY